MHRSSWDAYLSEWKEAFCNSSGTMEDQLIQMALLMEKSLKQYSRFLPSEAAAMDRLFILDVRSQVTSAMAELWAEFLYQNGICPEAEYLSRGQFLAGGIGELIFQNLTEEQQDEAFLHAAMHSIIFFVLSAMNFSEEKRRTLLAELEKKRQLWQV